MFKHWNRNCKLSEHYSNHLWCILIPILVYTVFHDHNFDPYSKVTKQHSTKRWRVHWVWNAINSWIRLVWLLLIGIAMVSWYLEASVIELLLITGWHWLQKLHIKILWWNEQLALAQQNCKLLYARKFLWLFRFDKIKCKNLHLLIRPVLHNYVKVFDVKIFLCTVHDEY